MNMPTQAQVVSFGRHIVTFGAGAITAGAALHVINGSQAQDATAAISQISSGVASITAGLTTLIGLGSALWAAWSASPFRQLLSVAKNPDVKQVVTTPELATAAGPVGPGAKVVSP